ncbi:unnamed protein product, partial [Prunus brigantina]
TLSLSLSPESLSARKPPPPPPPRLLFTETETTAPPPRPTTSALDTGLVRLVVKPRTRTTQNPDRKTRESSTTSTGSNRIFPDVAPSSPSSIPGEKGGFDRTQQAGPSQGRAAWDYLQ